MAGETRRSPHRAEKARADLQAEGIDEDDEAEILGIGEHRRVERQSEVPGQNAHEEDEGRAERDAEEPDFSQSDADCRDERNHHDGLQGRMLDEQIFKPFHPNLVRANRCKSRSNFRDCRLSARKFASRASRTCRDPPEAGAEECGRSR